MTDEPDARGLLQAARDTVLGELLAALPADRRYPALMVANAIAIALREIGEDTGAPTPDEVAEAARLAREIRAGAHDGAGSAALHADLTLAVLRRLTISNPRDPRLRQAGVAREGLRGVEGGGPAAAGSGG